MEKAAVIFISIIVVISVAIGGLGYMYFSGDSQEAYSGTPIDVGDTSTLPLASDFNLPKVGGGYVRLSDLKGQVVILDFMATWCGPCETELAHLEEIYNSYSSSQVRILSIDVDKSESEALLSSYIDKHNIPWDTLMDFAGINNDPGYDVTAIPTLVIVDQDGGIAFRGEGIVQSSTLKAEINSLL